MKLTDKQIIDKGRNSWSSWKNWQNDLKNRNSYSFTKAELKIIRENDLKCSGCGENIFELQDFPVIKDDNVFCEDCYDDEYRDICPLCQDSYENDNVQCEQFPKSPFYYGVKEDRRLKSYHPQGVYEAINYPIFIGATGGLGETMIQWDNVRLICTKEEYLKLNPYSKEAFEGGAEFICNECWSLAKRIKDNK